MTKAHSNLSVPLEIAERLPKTLDFKGFLKKNSKKGKKDAPKSLGKRGKTIKKHIIVGK